ncbi:homoserine dehydrogenase [Methanobacterium petrolearium]|uniref:homoserine dehydrogenase n=1 Tax=Methanobacterium petrolearium TaxID=710190 RepID=UPI001AE5B58B|nr:homoserine dehydrogenase [Methanobacterium petrolearium]MBP1946804.1 homoserine dehydrogenase [Methanobacterium petrolearium]BDZ69777.1 homoserine dehydrogenase [Methanobacterium petrolearium]
MEETINIGLIGFGTIGSGVVATLGKNMHLIEDKVQKKVKLKKIVDLDITTDRGVDVDPEVLTTNVDDILEDDEINIVIELIGGYQPALNFILKAMENGKHVVTANKALLAKHWQEIMDCAIKNHVRICFEASVGGGIPLLAPLNNGLAANNIETVYGIINGTANYILTKMDDAGLDFDVVLKEAQLMGYAEQDPTFDIEGHDTAQKLIILSMLGFGIYVSQENFHVEGITRIKPDDIKFARKELNSVVKLLAIAQVDEDGKLEIRVHPTLVPQTHLLASVNDVFNAVYIVGDIGGPVLMYGQGAGMMPTASAVVADCIDIMQDMDSSVAYGPSESRVKKIKDMSNVESKYYLRITALDKPGVLHSLSGILSDLDISIESVSQRKVDQTDAVPIFMVTHHALEKNVQKAIKLIDKLDFVKEKTMIIRLL